MSELKDASSKMLDDEQAKKLEERTSELLKMLGSEPLKAHAMVDEGGAIGELTATLLSAYLPKDAFTSRSIRPSEIPAPGMQLKPIPECPTLEEMLQLKFDPPMKSSQGPRKLYEVRDVDESSMYEGYMVHLNLDSQTFLQKLIGDEKTPEVAEGVEILPSMSGTLRRIAPDLYHEYEEALLEDEGED